MCVERRHRVRWSGEADKETRAKGSRQDGFRNVENSGRNRYRMRYEMRDAERERHGGFCVEMIKRRDIGSWVQNR